MTEEDKAAVLATTPEDAASDICSYVEDLLGHPLTENHKLNLSVKAKYWFMLGAIRQDLAIVDKFKSMAKEHGLPQGGWPSNSRPTWEKL